MGKSTPNPTEPKTEGWVFSDRKPKERRQEVQALFPIGKDYWKERAWPLPKRKRTIKTYDYEHKGFSRRD
jgi:hypothetical protein